MNNAAQTPAYNTNGVRVAPYTERETFFLTTPGTYAEKYRAWQALPKGGHYRWPTYNEVQDALHGE